MRNDTTIATLRALVERGIRHSPDLEGRIHRAAMIALFRRVERQPDGAWLVESEAERGKLYRVTDWATRDAPTCECPDVQRAPQGRCKHKLAIMLTEAVERERQERAEQDARDLLAALGPPRVAGMSAA